MKPVTAAAAAITLLISCSNTNAVSSTDTPDTTAAAIAELQLPAVPPTLVTPADRAAYIVAHFWDNMDFADTIRSHDTNFIEQNFANFASLFPLVDADTTLAPAAAALMKRAEADRAAYNLLAETADKYLYDPNSPMLDEASYIPFLRAITASTFIEPALRARYEAQLADATKNLPGTIAADFTIARRDGSATTLHRLCRGARAVILMFYDPDCENCAHLISQMKSDPALSAAVASGKVKIVAIYPDGEADLFAAGAGKIPAEWTDGMSPDGEIVESETYSIRATPTLYLLDGSARVVMKDADAAAAVPAALRM